MSNDGLSEMAAALRWLRERIGISRDELAAAAGVSAVHIKFIERGKRNPSEAVIQRLLPALRVTRADLDGLLRLRPWASSTASGAPATLSAYSAGVPLAVGEGSEFDLPSAQAPASVAPSAQAPASVAPSAQAPASVAPSAQAPALVPAPVSAQGPTRTPTPASAPPPVPAPTPAAMPMHAATHAQPHASRAMEPSLPYGMVTGPPAGGPPSQPPGEAPSLDAELIELRERYVHLPRSKQEMVLGWLRALDDR